MSESTDQIANRPASPGSSTERSRRLKRDVHHWSRWLHVYTSMIAFIVVLFFAFTGLTLNHPQWTFGDEVNSTSVSGQLGVDTTLPDGSVNYLGISEYLRTTQGVQGHVDSFDTVNGEGLIEYKNAGYLASVTFDVNTGSFTLNVDQQGWVGVINDLHKGRDTGSSWKWLIDVAAIFLIVISVSGLVMQFFLRKRRVSAFTTLAVGAVIVLFVAWFTLR